MTHHFIHHIYNILRHGAFLVCMALMLICITLAGCQADEGDSSANSRKKVDVRLSLSASATSIPRTSSNDDDDNISSSTWDDSRAINGEMMRNCFVVAVQNGQVVGFIECDDFKSEKSFVSELAMKIDTGQTSFYSFANIKPAELGINPTSCVGEKAPDFDNMAFGVKGNVDKVDDFANGIPMSGKLTMDVTENTQQVALEVIRMVAKVKVSLTNDTPADFKVKAVSLSDITSDASGNLMLMPHVINSLQCEPNLAPTATKALRTVTIGNNAGGTTLHANRANSLETTFYVNESEASIPKYFVVNVETDQTSIAHRVALLSWNTIARGDYVYIPIRLNDYRITYDVEQFTAIGVLPSVDNNKDMLTVRFNGYGEFHMRPTVTRLSDGKVLTPGTDATDGWTLVDWSVLELSPEGDEGTCIYDRMPIADHSRRMFEGVIGNRKGYALHQVLFHVKGLTYDIPYKVQIIHE